MESDTIEPDIRQITTKIYTKIKWILKVQIYIGNYAKCEQNVYFSAQNTQHILSQSHSTFLSNLIVKGSVHRFVT